MPMPRSESSPWDEVIFRLREVEVQLRDFTRYTLLHDPEMPRLLARDVEKIRKTIEELRKA